MATTRLGLGGGPRAAYQPFEAKDPAVTVTVAGKIDVGIRLSESRHSRSSGARLSRATRPRR